MAQHYSDPFRATDPHALPDVETFHADHPWGCPCDDSCEGGWYWQACFPGCLPDSAPIGPFATEAEALADAQEHSQ